MVRRTSPLWVLAMAAVAVPLLSLALGCARDAPLRIGGIFPLTGGGGSIGSEVRDGAQLAIDEVNAWGGVDGRTLQLIVQDSASDPQTAKTAFQQIEVAYHPVLYLSTTSTVTVALAPLAEAARAVLIGLVVTTARFPGSSEWAFRYYPTADDDIATIIPVLRQLKARTIGVLYLDDDFGTSIYEILRRESRAIGVEAVGISYPASTTDFAPYLARLAAFDAVYLNGFVQHLEAIYGQLAAHPLAKPIFSNNASAIPQLMACPTTNGVYVGAPVIYNDGFRFAAETKKKYEARFEKPFNHFAANAYDAIKLVAGLLEGLRGDRDALRIALTSGFRYSGILGELSTKPGERSVSFPQLPARILDGRIVYLNLDIPASVTTVPGAAATSR